MKKGTIRFLCAFGLIYLAMKDSLEKYVDDKFATFMVDHYQEMNTQK